MKKLFDGSFKVEVKRAGVIEVCTIVGHESPNGEWPGKEVRLEVDVPVPNSARAMAEWICKTLNRQLQEEGKAARKQPRKAA